MLIDKRRITIKAGDGGRGAVSFNPRTKKPNGGLGGDGGNIYFEGTTNLYDLKSIRNNEELIAENGEPGSKNNKDGKDGEDLIVKVPLVTHLKNLEGDIILTIDKDGERKLVAEGGRGGWGNYRYKAGQKFTLKKFQHGKPGEKFEAILELNLEADVIFVGFPNAGKSTLLNSLTNANVKVAPYPFTTLEPHLGVVKDLILMDLPGFIEGTVDGKGLGTKFTKHMKQAKLVAHVVSLENNNIHETYKKMKKELKEMHEELANKPEAIILTKADLFEENQISEKISSFENKRKSEILAISAYNHDDLKLMYPFLKGNIEKKQTK